MSDDLKLAIAICACPEVQKALISASHPCRGVVFEQNPHISSELERQRPEPWVGTLTQAKLLFLSSNPGLSTDPGLEREDFPTQAWQPENAGVFFVERFNQENKPIHATFGQSEWSDFLTRSLDNKYRSGTKTPERSQPTWKNTHSRAKELLGEDCHPHTDYVITEIVHCKSKAAEGVRKASRHCVDTWLSQILALSPAPVIVALGTKVRDNFAIPILGFKPSYGFHPGYKSLSQKERALRDIEVTDFGGKKRLVVFNFHPVAMEMKNLNAVYGEKIVKWLSSVISGNSFVPASNRELEQFIEQLFND